MNTENNILIAEFMGYEVINEQSFLDYTAGAMKGKTVIDASLKYHSSWDWLMPVVEKIESLHEANNVLIGTNITYIQIHNQFTNEQETFKGAFASKLESVYNAVIEFIKWYNENSAEKK